MDEHQVRIEAALSRQRTLRETGAVTMSAETAWQDAEVLAIEVVRLRRLLDARPPYRMSDGWTPAEMAALLHRDSEILRAVDAREDVEP